MPDNRYIECRLHDLYSRLNTLRIGFLTNSQHLYSQFLILLHLYFPVEKVESKVKNLEAENDFLREENKRIKLMFKQYPLEQSSTDVDRDVINERSFISNELKNYIKISTTHDKKGKISNNY